MKLSPYLLDVLGGLKCLSTGLNCGNASLIISARLKLRLAVLEHAGFKIIVKNMVAQECSNFFSGLKTVQTISLEAGPDTVGVSVALEAGFELNNNLLILPIGRFMRLEVAVRRS